MVEAVLLSVEQILPLDKEARRRLDAVSKVGHQAWDTYLSLPPEILQRTLDHVEFILRRWVLELLLVIRRKDEIHYGAIARALGGLPSGSLSPKLRDLEEKGLIQVRSRGLRRYYAITPEAVDLANAVYCLASAKCYHHASVQHGQNAPDIGSFTGLAPVATKAPTVAGLTALQDDFAAAAASFYAYHSALQPEDRMEATMDTARRFTEACSRKWNGVIMVCLMRGNASFTQLKDMAGLGNQALTNAINELLELKAVHQTEEGYELAPFGVFDMGFGTNMVAMYERVQDARSTPSA